VTIFLPRDDITRFDGTIQHAYQLARNKTAHIGIQSRADEDDELARQQAKGEFVDIDEGGQQNDLKTGVSGLCIFLADLVPAEVVDADPHYNSRFIKYRYYFLTK
jgi:hypothetical protein